MAHYIIQIIAFQIFFLLIYDVFLKKETFFNWNRFYLISTAILSLVLPFIKIESFKSAVPQQYIVSLPEIFLGQTISNSNNTLVLDTVVINNGVNYLQMVFYLGVSITAVIFLFKLIKILVLIIKNPKTNSGKLILVKLINSNVAFSFFRYVFLGEFLKQDEKEAILKHEIIHANQMHSIDLLLFEVLRILFWFNPLVYMYQNRMVTLHEFIADAEAVKYQNKSTYYQNLLAQVFETQNISFINPFFKQSLIKKRIVMLQKSKSKQIKLLKYALLIPMVLIMLIYTSCSSETNTIEKDLSISDQIELLKSMIKENKGVISESDKIELFKLINGKDLGKYKVVEGVLNEIEVPFAFVEHPPVFPGCEDLEREEQKKCFSVEISQHVNEHFNTKIANELNLTGKQRINVIFKIDKEGNVTDLRSRAPHPKLEEEAIRVIKTLPKIIPGIQKGKKVTVLYSLPIVFQIDN